jgi:aspartate aminotransferase-like enzyme
MYLSATLTPFPLGVLSDPQPVAEVVQKVSPETLVVLDAVCAVASEDIQMDRWGIDVVITASQKGLGAPPGLSVVIASQKAMKVKFRPCRRIYWRSADRFSRFLRHAQSRSPRSTPAGRGKIIHNPNSAAIHGTHRIADGSLS